jgi:hypothetical protein
LKRIYIAKAIEKTQTEQRQKNNKANETRPRQQQPDIKTVNITHTKQDNNNQTLKQSTLHTQNKTTTTRH